MLYNVNNKVFQLFDNAFIRNKACDAIKSIQWFETYSGRKVNQLVLEQPESYINKQMIYEKNLLMSGVTEQGKSNVINVDVKMLKTDWITRNGNLHKLVDLFSEAKDELFKTDLFRTLMGGFWDRLKSAIISSIFIPFCVFLMANIIYCTVFLQKEKVNLTETEAKWEIFTWVILETCQLYFLILYLIQIVVRGRKMLHTMKVL